MSPELSTERTHQGPPILYLNSRQGARAATQALHDKYIVAHYGATYGTAFLSEHRLDVARARKETANPPVTVSIVSTLDKAIGWMDRTQIDPRVNNIIDQGGLKVFEMVSFILFPANPTAKNHLGEYCVNRDGGVQVFCVPETDIILDNLQTLYKQDHFLVRSSNLEGEEEKFGVHGAYAYAKDINATALVLPYFGYIEKEHPRRRTMSQPIISLPTISDPRLILRRDGNTSPETLERLCKEFTDSGIEFVHIEAKKSSVVRPKYSSPANLVNPADIQDDLIFAAGL